MSIWYLAAVLNTSSMVLTPSETWPISINTWCSSLPSAKPKPTRRLRESAPVQVSIRSPMPASPIRVLGWAPMATARRVISARPRVTRAARALRPYSRPSERPVAMAMMFFTAPPTATPTASLLPYSRITPVLSCGISSSIHSLFSEARTTAQGSCCASSCAKLGPESTPIFLLPGNTSLTTWKVSRPVSCSKPLQAASTGRWAASCCLSRPALSRRPATDVAMMASSEPFNASPKSVWTYSVSGKVKPGSPFLFSRSAWSSFIYAVLRDHRATSLPCWEKWRARAVPHEPAPRTVIFMVFFRLKTGVNFKTIVLPVQGVGRRCGICGGRDSGFQTACFRFSRAKTIRARGLSAMFWRLGCAG